MHRRATLLSGILGEATRADWAQFEGVPALRCAVGVGVPLAIGLLLQQPAVSAFGAVGAVSVGFGSFQGAYRSRAAVMLWASFGMAAAMLLGSLAGFSDVASVALGASVAFASGMLDALGPAASFVGIQTVVAVLVASGFPADLDNAAARAAMVLGGGLVQTVLVVVLWPLRRFAAERAAMAAVYRSLAGYAHRLDAEVLQAPEPHTLAATASPLRDPQPFARTGDVLVFQALLDEAERIRASLAAIATRLRALDAADAECARTLGRICGDALAEIADALDQGRDPKEAEPWWARAEACATRLPHRDTLDALLGQIRAAWRTASVMSTSAGAGSTARIPPLRRRPPIRDAMTTLAANLTFESAVLRHAMRLGLTTTIAAAVFRFMHLPRGYWVPMTAVLVLKPGFHDTFSRGLGRIAGTILGSALATVVVHAAAPGPLGLTALVLVCVWGCYAVFRINYGFFTVFVTGYVVFVLMLSGVPEMPAATTRALDTLGGGLLALAAYAVWPTWTGHSAVVAIASMLDAHAAYVDALLAAYMNPSAVKLSRLGELRAAGRLARSNAEALVDRMMAEPEHAHGLNRRAALGVLAAIRRHALAALALHAAIERGISAPLEGLDPLRTALVSSLTTLADAVRHGTPPPPLPALRRLQLATVASAEPIAHETDLMVDSINTIAELLAA